MMFPIDAVTEHIEINGVGSFDFDSGLSGEKTIFSIAIQQSGTQSDSMILCGSETIAKNYALGLQNILLQTRCSGVLSAEKTGAGDSAFFNITYVPYYIQNSSSTPFYVYGFSYDGLFIGIILFFMFCLAFFGGLWNRVIGVKTKKKAGNEYLGNNSQEGKIIYYD